MPAPAEPMPAPPGRLEVVHPIDPPGSRTRQLLRCPACGAWFPTRTDEEFPGRLGEAEADASLDGPAGA